MKIAQLEKISFTRHLAVMIKSGITLSEALDNLSEGAKTPSLKKVVSELNKKINNGATFTRALEKYPLIFDDFYRGIIKVGESTGNLDGSLNYLAQQLSQDYSTEKKVRGALLYPSLVIIVSLILFAFVSLYILPQLVDFFNAFNTELPASTRFLLAVATFMKQSGILVFTLLGIVIFIGLILIRLPLFKPGFHRLVLRLPLFGGLLRERELARFSRNLGTLIKSGLPVFEALKITAESQTNLAYRRGISSLSSNLEKGENIGKILKKPSFEFLFPRLVGDMVSVGEKTGTIEESLLYVAEYYDQDIEESARNLTNILEPVILIIIGLMVGFLALSIISPIYQLTGSIG